MPLLSDLHVQAVRHGDTNINKVYHGANLIWPNIVYLPAIRGDVAAAGAEAFLGRPLNTAETGMLLTQHDTGIQALWINSNTGSVGNAPPATVVMIATTPAADFERAGGELVPCIAHNGTWWRLGIVPAAGVVSQNGHPIRLNSNFFAGFWDMHSTVDGLTDWRTWANNILEDDEFAIVYDETTHTLNIAAKQQLGSSMHFSPIPVPMQYHLPPGMTDADVIWPPAPTKPS